MSLTPAVLYESPAALRDFYPQAFIDITSTFKIKPEAVATSDSQSQKRYMRRLAPLGDPCSCDTYGKVLNAVAGLSRFRELQVGLGSAETFEVAKFVLDLQILAPTSSTQGDAEVTSGLI